MAGATTSIFLAPEEPVLAGVRIEPGDGKAWCRQPESRQLHVGEVDRVLQLPLRQDLRNAAQRHVHGREHHAQGVRVEHHRHPPGTSQMGEQVGVSRPRQPRGGERRLADRCGGDRIDRP